MDQKTNDSGWRGSPEAWLQAAYDALIESGVEGVRILPLAKRLRLSRTSFYWFFRDREELLTALVGRWKDINTGALVSQSQAYAETAAEAVLNVFDCWMDPTLFDSRLEFAIRSWSLQSPEVQAEVKQADQLRIDALAGMFQRFGRAPVAADVRARALYLVQIGYITMGTQEDIETRMRRVPSYIEIFSGKAPGPREMARFAARHGYAWAP